MKKYIGIVLIIVGLFGDNDPFRLAAVVSYFAIFSLPGFLNGYPMPLSGGRMPRVKCIG